MAFTSPKLLLNRARDHITDVNGKITEFFSRRPYAPIVERDPQTGQDVYKIRLTGTLPDNLSVIVKDAAGNLRDALDHAVYASARLLNGGELKNTGFPFAKDAAGVTGELNSRRLSDIPPEIRPLLAGFRPHEGGNDLLWGLNSIRNPNTHRMLVPVGQAMMGPNISISTGILTGNTQIGYSRWNAAKNEVEYMRLGAGSKIQHEVQAAFTVTFEGVHALSRKPIIPTLNAIAGEVERVVLTLETETGRLLAAKRNNAQGSTPAA